MSVSTPAVLNPLALRRRADLRMQRVSFGGPGCWSIQDPLALRNYQLRDEEQYVMLQLDGRTSLEEIQARFHTRFMPRRVSAQQLQWFFAMLHREGLIVSDAPGQGDQLLQRGSRLRSIRRWARFANPLAIRFRGINPDPILRLCYPRCRWMFSTWCVAGSLMLVLSALCFALACHETLRLRLPELPSLFAVDNLLWLAAAMGVAKVLHEFGHALTCHYFGGRCREWGLMLLVFTPCMYCNVSDAWLLPSKWKRIAISAAGIYVELVLASLCLFLWSYTEPGLLNSICLNLVVICSVNTLLFNGNPLLRFDGYFMLADFFETPNLNEESMTVVRHGACRLLGIDVHDSPLAPPRGRWFLASYAIIAKIYRCFLLIAILWLCHYVLREHGLALLSCGLVVTVLMGMSVAPLRRGIRFFRDPSWSRQMNWTRMAAMSLLLVGLASASTLVPLPYRVWAPVYVEPLGATPVYVSVPGQLTDCVAVGEEVQLDAVLARLSNLEIAKEVTALTAQRNLQRLEVQNLERQQVHDRRFGVAGASGQLPSAREALADLESRLRQKETEQQCLTIRSPCAGTVLSPRRREAVHPEDQEVGLLPGWSGTPLDHQNRGCRLEAATVLCSVGDPGRLAAVVVVEQERIRDVSEGQLVWIQLDELPSASLRGQVEQISELDLASVPPELLAKGLIRSRLGENDPRPLSVSYQVRVRLDGKDGAQGTASIPIHASGRAKIRVAPRTLASRAYTALCRTFRIEL